MPVGYIANAPLFVHDNIHGKQPSKWYGYGAPGTVSPFSDAAVGSEYTDVTGGTATIYFRHLAANEVASWGTVSYT